jgi:hypothetical protein
MHETRESAQALSAASVHELFGRVAQLRWWAAEIRSFRRFCRFLRQALRTDAR